jgi:hypothetical protein
MPRLIDADALLEKRWDADTRCGYVQVVDVSSIENAPTIDPVKWIPVSERLPDNGYALACCSSGNRVTTFFWAGRSDDLEKMGYEVTHWMPLPEPPSCGCKMDESKLVDSHQFETGGGINA